MFSTHPRWPAHARLLLPLLLGLVATLLGAAPASATTPDVDAGPAAECLLGVSVTGVQQPSKTWVKVWVDFRGEQGRVRVSGDGRYLIPMYSATNPRYLVTMYESDDPYGDTESKVLVVSAADAPSCPYLPEPLAFTPASVPGATPAISFAPGPECETIEVTVAGVSGHQDYAAVVNQDLTEAGAHVIVEADGTYVVEVIPYKPALHVATLTRYDESSGEESEVAATTGEVAVERCAPAAPEVPLGGYPQAVATMGDHTGDGLADVYGVTPDGYLDLALGQPRSMTQLDHVYTGWPTLAGVTYLVQIGDWSGDRRSDVLARRADHSLWIYTSTATGALIPWKKVGQNWGSMDKIVYAGTLAGTTTKYVVARQAATGDLYRYQVTTTGLTGTTKIGRGWTGMRFFFSVGDFNADGRGDIIGVRRSDGTMWLYPGRPNGTLDYGRQVGRGWGGFTHAFSPGDFSGDGRFDLLGVDASGTLWGYHNTGRGGWSAYTRMGSGYQQYALLA